MKSKRPKSNVIKSSESNCSSNKSKITKSVEKSSKTKVKRASRSINVDKKSAKRNISIKKVKSSDNNKRIQDFVKNTSRDSREIINETSYNTENSNDCPLNEKDSKSGNTNHENGNNVGENSKYRGEFKCPDCNRYFKSRAGLRKHELSCYDFKKTTADINNFIASLKVNGTINSYRNNTEDSDLKPSSVSESITLSNVRELDKNIEPSISETVSSLNPQLIAAPHNLADQSKKAVSEDEKEIKELDNSQNSTHNCLYCKKVFKTVVGCRRHEVNCKRKPGASDEISLNGNQGNGVELALLPVPSSNCKDALSTNVDGNTNVDECNKDFSKRPVLTLSKLKRKKGEYHCHECGKAFRLKYSLQRHIRVIHNHEQYLSEDKCTNNVAGTKNTLDDCDDGSVNLECHLCGEKCPDKNYFNTHILIHSGYVPSIIECHLCGERCADKESHTRHMRIHSGCVRSESEASSKKEISDVRETLNETKLYNECEENEVETMLLTERGTDSSDPLSITGNENVSEGTNDNSYEKNLKKIQIERKFECNECGKSFFVKSSLERHIRVTHNKGSSHECPQCEAKFPDKGSLARHMYTHTGLKPYSCPVCKQEFSRKYHLVRHNMQTGCDGRERPVYPCQVCGREFNRKDNLREHLRAHAGQTKRKKNYTCESCGLHFENIDLIKIHRKEHTGEKEYPCEFCPKKFFSAGSVKKHRRTHTGEKPYVCQMCDKRFAAKETLNRHVRIHTGYKPHTCPYCDKSFIQSTQLKTHILCHTGSSVFQLSDTFVCDLCGKKFNRRTRLNEHVKFLHLGAKPFECEHCDKTFIRREDLNRHLMIHSGVRAHQCPICPKSFTMKSTLKVHLLTHTKEPPRSCDACGRAFIRQDCLLRHMKTRHREMLEEIKSEAEKKKLQQQLLQVAAEASLVEGMEERKELDEDGLIEAVKELLTLLVDETTLRGLGWPDAGVEALLEAVIKRCGHDPAPTSIPRHDSLRHNIKLLFTVVIDDSAVKALLNNQTVDEVILHVLRLAKS